MMPLERAFVISYSNSSSNCTRLRDIAAFVLQHTIFSHPTSSLPKISPCSLGDCLWAVKSEGVGLTVRAISSQDFQPMWS